MSERGRIARAAEETSQTEPTKKPTKSRSQPPATRVRVKVVWEVCSGAGTVVKTFPYPEKAAAEAKIKALTISTRRVHMLRATKVPME